MVWELNDSPIEDAFGAIIECDSCPCDNPPCDTCEEVVSYYSQFSELYLELDFTTGAFCVAGACDSLDGNYTLAYLADPSPIDNAATILQQQDIVWAYEFPTPITINCGGFGSFRVTHIIGSIICAGGDEVRLVVWYRIIPAAALTPVTITQLWRRVTSLSDPDVDCTDSGDIPIDSLSNACTPVSDAYHEFNV
jgi:hypothetical protein